MRWQGRRASSNIEDRRGMSAAGIGGFGGSGLLRLLPLAFRFLGFKGTAVVAVGLIGYSLFTGGDLGSLLSGSGLQSGSTGKTAEIQQSAEEKELVQLVSVVLADTEDTWRTLFRNMGKRYQEPKLVLFRNAVKSACGMAQSAIGPFYCPADQQVYIDLGFYDELKNRFKAPGDFAQAYVIAHEIGHHIQTLLGISSRVHKAKSRLSKIEANKLSVKQELQADCFAGVWAYYAKTRDMLEPGDLEEGLRAASAIGDDNIQKQSRGYVTPDSFTHGSSKQRVKWFRTGYDSGDIGRCDPFKDGFLPTQAARAPATTIDNSQGSQALLSAFRNRQSDVQIQGSGIVKRVLPDDNEGSRHQKFILSVGNGQSVLVAHNIDLAPRIPGLKVGDRVEFYGEYEWNERGGVLHWTHDDPRGRHEDGWLKHNGRLYQ